MINYEIIRLKTEAKQIEDWFKETDYFVNKIIRGEWEETNPKWVEYKSLAKEKSKRLEELKEIILKERKERLEKLALQSKLK
jgi:hypothetical protein